MRTAYKGTNRLWMLLIAMLLVCGMAFGAIAEESAGKQGTNDLDGSKIEGVKVIWVTQDSATTAEGAATPQTELDKEDHLYLSSVSDSPVEMVYRIEAEFSGQYDYAPGDITITIPAQVWYGRKYEETGVEGETVGVVDENRLLGYLELPVPAAPSKKADFNWQIIDGNYVLTNTRTIGATSSVSIEVGIRGIRPVDVVDMSETAPITAHVEVVTNQGNTIELTSTPIVAQLDTQARITSAYKDGEVFEDYPGLSDQLLANLPAGAKPEDYIYVRWYTYHSHNNNQPYSLDIADVLSDAYEKVVGEDGQIEEKYVTDGIFLGSTNYEGQVLTDGEIDFTAEIGDHFTTTTTGTQYANTVYMWSAYKKDAFTVPNANERQRVYYFENEVTWTLTETDKTVEDSGNGKGEDPQKVTTAKDDVILPYAPVKWQRPRGAFAVNKWTERVGYKDWLYGYALNLLESREEVDMDFIVETVGYGYPWTSKLTKDYSYIHNAKQSDLGEHTYTVKEVKGDLDGVTYDETTYEIKVTVTDNGDGTLEVVASDNATALNFTNTYEAKGKVDFTGLKKLEGRELKEGEFSFILLDKDGKEIETVKNSKDGKIAFTTLEYIHNAKQSDLGEHTYTVKETSTDGNGITVAKNTYTVTVNVSDNGDGTLEVEPSKNYTELDFINKYEATGEITFEGKKNIDGRKLTDEDIFSFSITEEVAEGKTGFTGTATNDATGKIVYPTIEYIHNAEKSDLGEHTYTVKEISEDGKGITVSKETYTVTVTVSDNGDGTWTVENDKEGKIAYPKIEYTLDDVGTHTYTVKETSTDGNGITVVKNTHTVTVKVSDNGDGTLKVVASDNAKDLNFTNTYEAKGKVDFTGLKKLEGRELKEGEFSFILLDKDGKEIETVKNGKDGKIAFTTLNYIHNATTSDLGEHTYTVKEVIPADAEKLDGVTYDEKVYTIKVTVTDNGDGTLEVVASDNATALNFTNTYEVTGSVTFEGAKTLTGRDLAAEEFSFVLLDENGDEIETVKNDAEGNIAFKALEYIHNAEKSDLGDHTYTVKEVEGELDGVTYDKTSYEIKVTVTDNGDGTLNVVASDNAKALDFKNLYEADGTALFTGTKVLVGREFRSGDVFLFELVEDGVTIQRSRLTPVEGTEAAFEFKPIEYTTADIGTHTYLIREEKGSIKGVTYDATEYTVTVTVADAGNGKLSVSKAYAVDGETAEKVLFTNTYEATGELTLTAEKTVNGATPTADQVFDFTLSDASGEIEMVQNKLGEIVFAKLSYTLDDLGEHTYTVKESKTDKAGYAIDETVYTVKVNVTDNGDGTLKVEKKITANGKPAQSMAFDNKHSATLTISKKVEGCTTEETFPIKVWLFDAKGNELKGEHAYTGDVTGKLTSGEAIELGHGQTITIENLPVGSRYKVEETRDPRFTTTVNSLTMNTAEGEIVEGGNTAAFVNELITTEFAVWKEWRGGEGGKIRLTLYANGEKLDPQPEYENNGNLYKYTELPKFDEDGDEIIYTAKEKYMDGYLTIYNNVSPYETVTDVIHNGGTIINKAVMDFKVQKVWSGLAEGAEVPEITLILYCNGEVYEHATPKPDSEGWYHYRELPIFVNGERAVYSVTEVPMEGCSTIYSNNGEEGDCAYNGGVITNVVVPKTGDDAPVELWMAAMLLSAAALVMMARRKKAN